MNNKQLMNHLLVRIQEALPEAGFVLESAYGGFSLRAKGGTQDVLFCGFLKPAQLVPRLEAFLKGIYATRGYIS